MQRNARDLGEDVTDFQILSLLTFEGRMTVGHLAELTRQTTASTTAVIDRMGKWSYVQASPR
ncbi:MAG: hypothetical protein ACLQMF_17525 [Rectinemataceae bacterium]